MSYKTNYRASYRRMSELCLCAEERTYYATRFSDTISAHRSLQGITRVYALYYMTCNRILFLFLLILKKNFIASFAYVTQ
jgi:hypothetical protein